MTGLFGLRDGEIEKIAGVLRTEASIREAMVFGSRALGNFKPASDVDIALKGDISHDSVARLSYLLNEETDMPYRFDLVDYSKIRLEKLRDHIDSVGRTIYKI